MTCRCESFNPGMTRRPFRSTTLVFAPRSYWSASSTPTMRPPSMAKFVALGCAGSRVVIRPLCRIISADERSLFIDIVLIGLQPAMQRPSEKRHDEPSQKRHDKEVEDEIVQDEI